MVTEKARRVRRLIERLKPVTNSLSVPLERLGQDVLGKVRPVPEGISFVEANVGEMPAEWVLHARAPAGKALFYVHGGAYFSGSLVSNRLLSVQIASTVEVNTFSFQYRLAPEYPFPAALEDSETAYSRLLESYDSKDVVFIGESAGGGLLVALALKLRDEGRPLPAGMVCMSPWTDLTLSGKSYETNIDADIMLTRDKLARAAWEYAPLDPANPYVSPAFGAMHDMPPTLIQVGSCELLLDDARMLSDAMADADVDVRLEEWGEMWHAWQALDIPEAYRAMRSVKDFVDARLGRGE
ncbi:MAG: alpha/beta hydrolase [Clostridia bacterium]|nr:alpha/beta hydrolase [Clostridia bacterium]